MTKPLNGLRVLLIDDSEDARDLFAMVLTEAGAEVRTARDGGEAMRTAALWPPNIVVSDLMLPGADGLTLLQELRSMDDAQQVPAIAVSGRSSGKSQAEALAAGFQEYVEKPIAPEMLVAIVQRWAATSGGAP